MSDVLNPRAVTGDNVAVDYAKEEIDRLTTEYGPSFGASVTTALDEARKLPAEIPDEPTASLYTETISRLRALIGRIEGVRILEKEPSLIRGRAIDQFFFTMIEKLERRKKTDRVGAVDVLHQRLHNYNQRRLEEERRKREEEARLRREEEERAAAVRRKAEAEKLEAEQRAARARKAENIEAAEKQATEKKDALAVAAAEEQRLSDLRRDADIAAAAKSADLVRERHESGSLNTMKQVGFAEITDRMALDKEELWPFIDEKAIQRALLAWSKVTQFKRQMNGASIGMRDATVVR